MEAQNLTNDRKHEVEYDKLFNVMWLNDVEVKTTRFDELICPLCDFITLLPEVSEQHIETQHNNAQKQINERKHKVEYEKLFKVM